MPGILSDPYEQDPEAVAFGDPEAQDVSYSAPPGMPHIAGGMGVRSPNGMPGLYANAPGGYAPPPQQEDTGILGKQPSQAAMLGLLSAGLGILANNTGNYGQAGPAIGRGGLLGVQSYLQAKQQEDVHNAMQQRVAQQQQAGRYQQALRQAYVFKPDTGEVDVIATRKNLAALDPTVAMKFDHEQAAQQASMLNLSRKNDVAQSLVAERRAKIMGAAKQNALEHFFGVLGQTQDRPKAIKAAADFYQAQIGDAQKQMLLPTDFKPAAFDVQTALRSLNEDGVPGLMDDSGNPVEGTPIQAQQQGDVSQADAPQEGMPQGGMMNVAQSTGRPPIVPNKNIDWDEVYQFNSLHKNKPSTALVLINPRTNKPIANEPLIAIKERLARANKTEVNVTAAGGDVIQPGAPARNELEKDIIASTNGLARLDSISARFKPEYLELPNQLVMKGVDFANKLGIPVSDEHKTRLIEFTKFRQDAFDNMNRYIKEITGAQMSEQEADRLRKAMPDPENDSAPVFKAKMDHAQEILRAAGERYKKLRTEGLSVNQSQFEVKKDLLNGLAPMQTNVDNPSPPVPQPMVPKAPMAPKPMSPKAPTPQAPGQPKATKRYNPVSGKFEVIQ